jgi:hypothetical protein
MLAAKMLIVKWFYIQMARLIYKEIDAVTAEEK